MSSRSHPVGQNRDAGIVDRLKAHDAGALGEIMETLWEPLVAFAGRVLSGAGDPQDLVQDVLVRLWERRTSLRTKGSLRALLFTMVRNACLDEHRRRSRRDRTRAEIPPPPEPRTPYQDVQGAELERAAAAAVRKLPARRQEIFRLVREEGLTYQEVAQVLGLSPQTVANHMSLALADLRVALKPHISDPASQPTRRADPATDGGTTSG